MKPNEMMIEGVKINIANIQGPLMFAIQLGHTSVDELLDGCELIGQLLHDNPDIIYERDEVVDAKLAKQIGLSMTISYPSDIDIAGMMRAAVSLQFEPFLQGIMDKLHEELRGDDLLKSDNYDDELRGWSDIIQRAEDMRLTQYEG